MIPDSPDNPVLTRLSEWAAGCPEIQVAAVFGSMARGTAQPDSDIDIAVQSSRPLTVDQRIELIGSLSLAFDRPVDLVDLRTAGQPLLDQIVRTGIQFVGSKHQWGDLIYRNIMENEDFVPYQKRILEGRRKAWMNN